MEPTGDVDAQLLAWALGANLEDVADFHNYTRSLYREKYLGHKVAGEADKQKRIAEFDRMNVANSFLLTFAFLEEMLFLLWKVRAPQTQRAENGSALDRYGPVLRSLGVRIESLSCGDSLRDAEKIRHCLLHANGRMSMMRHPEDLKRRVAKRAGEVSIERDRIVLHPPYLSRCVAAVEELRDAALRI